MSFMKYIDIHGHVNFPAYDTDRSEVIQRANDLEVGMINVGTDLKTSKSAIELAEKNENMWATVGLHPVFCSESHNDENETGVKSEDKRAPESFNYEEFKELALNPKVVAIGECGFDFFHSKPEDIEKQKELFIQHIKLANEVNKPLMLHVRNASPKNVVQGQPSAYMQAVEILKEHAKVKANFHFFVGDLEEVKAILDIGCTVSFTGVLTFTRVYDEVVKYVPLTSIMSETDCPYVSPAPNRGKRNEPSYVVEIVKAIAQIRGESVDKVQVQLVDNAVKLFDLPVI